MHACDLIIFDLDGTLIDSRQDITHCLNAALRRLGLPEISEDIVAAHVGKGIRPLLVKALIGRPPADTQMAFQLFDELYAEHLAVHTTVYPGVRDVLSTWSHHRKVILTNKMDRFAQAIVQKLGLMPAFEAVYGRDAFPQHKPNPEPIREICRRHGSVPARTLVVGDTDVDILAGKSAGAKTCLALYGYGDTVTALALLPDYTVASAAELLML